MAAVFLTFGSLALFAVFALGFFFLFVPDFVALGDNVTDAYTGLGVKGSFPSANIDGWFEIVGKINLADGGLQTDDTVDAYWSTDFFAGFYVYFVVPAGMDTRAVE